MQQVGVERNGAGIVKPGPGIGLLRVSGIALADPEAWSRRLLTMEGTPITLSINVVADLLFILIHGARDTEFGVLNGFVKFDGPALAGSPIYKSYVPANLDVNRSRIRLGAHRGDQMALGEQLASHAVQVLEDRGTRRARVETVRDGIPRQWDFVPVALVVKMKQELLRHLGA